MRDQKTDEVKRLIGHGVKIKMDDAGNVLIKRISKSNIYIKNAGQDDETAIGGEILKLPACALEMEKPVKLFDMKKFQNNVNRELRRAYPDRRRLECQCLSTIAFVKNEIELLECPIWVLIINVVAMDMLKSKLPPVQKVVDIKNRPRIPIPDEDPYSVAGNGSGSSGSSNFATGSVAATREQLLLQSQQNAQRRSEKPPKLPPRENMYHHNIPKPDYDEEEKSKPFHSTRNKSKNKDESKYDDPYYCGLRARVPNFVSKSKEKEAFIAKDSISSKRYSMTQQPPTLPSIAQHQHHMIQQQLHQHPMWQRGNFENDSDNTESPYNQIYGRLPIPTRGYIPSQPRTMFIGEWD